MSANADQSHRGFRCRQVLPNVQQIAIWRRSEPERFAGQRRLWPVVAGTRLPHPQLRPVSRPGRRRCAQDCPSFRIRHRVAGRAEGRVKQIQTKE